MHAKLAAVLLALAGTAGSGRAQPSTAPPRGWEFFAIPTLNFASDEGFGYGALAEIYNYGEGARPYRFMLRPVVLITTKGRRDLTFTFDAPRLLAGNWRVDAFVGREVHLATPYYGIGNDAVFDEQLAEPPNSYFYRYGRTRLRLLANLQRPIGNKPARVLVGIGYSDATTDATPFDSGTTLLAQELGAATPPKGALAYARAGLLWDTRDREIGPSRGTWADLLVQRVDEALGASSSFTRVTGTVRKYVALAPRLVGAQRLLAQQTNGDVPLYDLATIQTTSGQQEGLGGGASVRGLPQNRFAGKGMFVSSSELRWRFTEFEVRRKRAFLVASGFADFGRVWTESIEPGELLSDLHAGYGGGLRLGLGPSFLIAFDLGRSAESTQIYIGLGYAF